MKLVRALFLVVVMLVLVVGIVSAAGLPLQRAEAANQSEVPEVTFTAEAIGMLAGVAISLLFNYFPRLRTAFAGLTQEAKSLIMIGLMLLVTAAVVALDWFDVINAGLTFDKAGIVRIVMTFVAAMMANQTTYIASPQKVDVINAKIARNTASLDRYLG